MRNLTAVRMPESLSLSPAGANMGPATPDDPKLTDDQHMDRERIGRVIAECQQWRRAGAYSHSPLAALPTRVTVILLDIAIATLQCRDANVAHADATSPSVREQSMADRSTAAMDIYAAVDRLLDHAAQDQLARDMQQRMKVFATKPSGHTERPHA